MTAKKTPAPKSIEGILPTPARKPVRRKVITKQGAMDISRPFISVRPQSVKPQPSIVPTPKILRQDVVVKLPRKLKFRSGILPLLQYMLLAVIAVAAGYSTSIGQWFVLAYAVYVLVTRQDSRLSFGIALFILVSVPFFQVINQPGVANNMAVYVYELLVVGTVQAVIELRRDSKQVA